MCNLNFDAIEKYYVFLDRLASYCDVVDILKEDDEDVYSKFIEQIKPFLLEVKWTRRFPGWGKDGNMKVRKYSLNKEVVAAFKEYNSFVLVGFDFETELGLDITFYK